MIKVYNITSKGKAFVRDRGFLELKGSTRRELRECLTMFYKDQGVKGLFCFDAHPEAADHRYTQHMKLLEKLGCITRNPEGEQEVKEALKSLPPESEISWTEILEGLT